MSDDYVHAVYKINKLFYRALFSGKTAEALKYKKILINDLELTIFIQCLSAFSKIPDFGIIRDDVFADVFGDISPENPECDQLTRETISLFTETGWKRIKSGGFENIIDNLIFNVDKYNKIYATTSSVIYFASNTKAGIRLLKTLKRLGWKYSGIYGQIVCDIIHRHAFRYMETYIRRKNFRMISQLLSFTQFDNTRIFLEYAENTPGEYPKELRLIKKAFKHSIRVAIAVEINIGVKKLMKMFPGIYTPEF